MPEPVSQISFKQQLEDDLDVDKTVALSVDAVGGKSAPSWSKSPNDFASDLERKLRFQLIDSGTVHRIADAGDDADHLMTVTITAFDHDITGLPGGDHNQTNSVGADVTLTDQTGERQLAAFAIRAEVGSEAAYGLHSEGTGLKGLLDAAARSVVDGLKASPQDDES